MKVLDTKIKAGLDPDLRAKVMRHINSIGQHERHGFG